MGDTELAEPAMVSGWAGVAAVSVNGVHWSCAHVVPLEKGGMQKVLPFCSMVFLDAFYLLLCFEWNVLLYLQPVLRLIILNLPAFATIYFHCGSLLNVVT